MYDTHEWEEDEHHWAAIKQVVQSRWHHLIRATMPALLCQLYTEPPRLVLVLVLSRMRVGRNGVDALSTAGEPYARCQSDAGRACVAEHLALQTPVEIVDEFSCVINVV